jgi:Tfp pilus assembly protein PilX
MTKKGCPSVTQPEQGMALVLVLVFTAALLVLGGALLTNAVNEKLIANYNSDDIRLYYLAEAGVEAGIATLQKDFSYSETLSGTLDEGHYQVSFQAVNAGCKEIVTTASLGHYTKTIRVTMTLQETGDEEEVYLIRWLRP